MRENSGVMSPAGSYQYLSTPDRSYREDDNLSTASGDSRRPSMDPAFLYANDQSSETWGSLTGALWDQFWGGSAQENNRHLANNLPQRAYAKASEITERFEFLYMKMPKRLPGPEAMQIQMTSCSRCLCCSGILFDEEVMSGWTADDSNLNTKCLFCHSMFVPFLTIRVIDFRSKPMSNGVEESNDDSENKENQNGEADKENVPPKSEVKAKNARLSEYITVPYISPLVLRKELENMLQTDGDQCLLDSALVDSHPIIYWNLLWYFERIAVKSHLPAHCLKAKSLNSGFEPDLTWADSDHRNISIVCRWDNERLHESNDPPLYSIWKVDDKSTSGLVEIDKQHPDYKGIMLHIISSVKVNDLLQPIETMLERRHSMKISNSPQKSDTPESPSSSAVKKTPRSIYREMLFLTLVALGQDNIDLTAFDREYRRAFEKLPPKYEPLVHLCDKPPLNSTVFCRKLFRELKL